MNWQSVEFVRGEYFWARYDRLVARLEKRGLRPLFVLDYSNSIYEPAIILPSGHIHRAVESPQHPKSIAAYARWAAAAAKHFHGHHVIWEIWNEPNGVSFWFPKPDVNQYIALMLTTSKAIRKADPHAFIIGPGTSGIPHEYLDRVLASGVLNYLDGVSVHPYRDSPPETALRDYQWLQQEILKYAPKGKKNIVVVNSEWGYATHDDELSLRLQTGFRGVSESTQAAYAVRQQLIGQLANIPVSIWYDWIDDGSDPYNREHHFGLVRTENPDGAKPALEAIATMTKELSGYSFMRRIDIGNSDDYVLLYKSATGQQKLILWTVDQFHDINPSRLSFIGVPSKVTDMTGNLVGGAQGSSWRNFAISPFPSYVSLASTRR